MITNDNKIRRFPPLFFYCNMCDVKCCKKSHYDEHILTAKHQKYSKMVTNGNKTAENGGSAVCQPQVSFETYICCCGKTYKFASGLSRHKKNCSVFMNDTSINSGIDKDFVMMILKENTEQFKDIITEVCKNNSNLSNTNLTNYTVNSHNKTFNLNLFLNEQCKDALNLTDFVDSIKLDLSDLENVGKVGFVNGITNIILKKLKQLDVHKRPVHCSDAKREVMYVKDEDKWGKENEERKKLKNSIKCIAHKNSKMLQEFRAKYPDCGKSESKQSDQYNKLVIEAYGGSGNEDSDNENKIIKNIAKEVVINKDQFNNL